MDFNDHFEGFEKEALFHKILSSALDDCPALKAFTVKNIISHVKPDFLKDLFERKPCQRKLKYIGSVCNVTDCSHKEDFFKQGEIYESVDFNGGTYTIKGYDRRIGCAYFERII